MLQSIAMSAGSPDSRPRSALQTTPPAAKIPLCLRMPSCWATRMLMSRCPQVPAVSWNRTLQRVQSVVHARWLKMSYLCACPCALSWPPPSATRGVTRTTKTHMQKKTHTQTHTHIRTPTPRRSAMHASVRTLVHKHRRPLPLSLGPSEAHSPHVLRPRVGTFDPGSQDALVNDVPRPAGGGSSSVPQGKSFIRLAEGATRVGVPVYTMDSSGVRALSSANVPRRLKRVPTDLCLDFLYRPAVQPLCLERPTLPTP